MMATPHPLRGRVNQRARRGRASPTPGGGPPETGVGKGAIASAGRARQSSTRCSIFESGSSSSTELLDRTGGGNMAEALHCVPIPDAQHTSPSAPVRVVIAQAHGLTRAGMRALLESYDDVV